jgi:sugar transferase EpsL
MIKKNIRIFDVLISLIVLIIFSPLIIIISFLLLVLDGRPIIYKQIRVGYKGSKFIIFKFRTMREVIIEDEQLRLTNLGKILRKSSLDELPQLINVLNRDMSLVGPRPLPEKIEKNIETSIKIKRRNILPGITGMSQINYSGKNRSLDEKINLDIEFIDNYTLQNYFIILLKTPLVLLKRFFKNKTSIIK